MAKGPVQYLLRLGLLLILIVALAAGAVLFRRVGLGEYGIILAVFTLLFVVESVRFVVRQFLKAFRGEEHTRSGGGK
jgi:hypothetical protein